LCRLGVVDCYEIPQAHQVADGSLGERKFHGWGAGNSLSVPQLRSHARTCSPSTTRPA
jgi:hypothetical protein